jgi:hypothetical protein
MVSEVRRLMAWKTLSSNNSLRVQYGGCHCFSTFFCIYWRSSAVETKYEGTGRFTPAARLIGRLFASRGLKSGHGDPSLFHWLRWGRALHFAQSQNFDMVVDRKHSE